MLHGVADFRRLNRSIVQHINEGSAQPGKTLKPQRIRSPIGVPHPGVLPKQSGCIDRHETRTSGGTFMRRLRRQPFKWDRRTGGLGVGEVSEAATVLLYPNRAAEFYEGVCS